MTYVSPNEYSVSDSQFDRIFNIVFMDSFNDKASRSVGQIKINIGSNIRTGTGTIIEWDTVGATIKVITAKHVIKQENNDNKGVTEDITFNLGQSSLTSTNSNISYLATFSENSTHRARIFFHNTLDVAYIIFPLNAPHTLTVNQISITNNILPINHGVIGRGKVRHVYHYPWGKQELRHNKGSIKSDKRTKAQKKYEVATLPGSSGAPVVVDDHLIGIHIQEGDESGSHTTYDGEHFNLTNNNIYVSMSHISNDFSDFHEVQRN